MSEWCNIIGQRHELDCQSYDVSYDYIHYVRRTDDPHVSVTFNVWIDTFDRRDHRFIRLQAARILITIGFTDIDVTPE